MSEDDIKPQRGSNSNIKRTTTENKNELSPSKAGKKVPST